MIISPQLPRTLLVEALSSPAGPHSPDIILHPPHCPQDWLSSIIPHQGCLLKCLFLIPVYSSGLRSIFPIPDSYPKPLSLPSTPPPPLSCPSRFPHSSPGGKELCPLLWAPCYPQDKAHPPGLAFKALLGLSPPPVPFILLPSSFSSSYLVSLPPCSLLSSHMGWPVVFQTQQVHRSIINNPVHLPGPGQMMPLLQNLPHWL